MGENREVSRDVLVSTSPILFWDVFQSALNLDFQIEAVFDTPFREARGEGAELWGGCFDVAPPVLAGE